MQNRSNASPWAKTIFAGALAGCLILAAPGASAATACQRRLARADHRLHDAARRHGWDSREAQHARIQLREAREYCWAHSHRWWDEDTQRWHTERDWDDHDHDRR